MMHNCRDRNACADQLENWGFQMDVGFHQLDSILNVVFNQERMPIEFRTLN